MTTNKLTRYSPGGYGAMTEDSEGDYVRLSEIEPMLRRAVDHAKDSGILAGSIIADENAEELRAARDLLRWRKVGEEMPPEAGYCIVMCSGSAALYLLLPGVSPSFAEMDVTHWRPIGPMPEGGE